MEYRSHRRLHVARDVGVPDFSCDAPRILIGLDNDDLRIAIKNSLYRAGWIWSSPEAAAQGFVLP